MTFLFDPAPVASVAVAGRGAFAIRRVFCVGRNYAAHAAEMGNEVDRAAPFYFTKTPMHVMASGGLLAYPPGTAELHHEIELAVALGPDGRMIAAGVALDMTRRDLQAAAKETRRPWDTGKDFEGAAVLAPMSPLEDVGARDIALDVNGGARQRGNTRDMVWPVPALLGHLATLYDLGAGDVILTGTPSGVGAVQPGDRLTGRIDGLEPLTLGIAPR